MTKLKEGDTYIMKIKIFMTIPNRPDTLITGNNERKSVTRRFHSILFTIEFFIFVPLTKKKFTGEIGTLRITRY